MDFDKKKILYDILDPFLEPALICRAHGISLATYYRYIKDLVLPVLKVGIPNYCEQPFKSLILRPKLATQIYDFKILRQIALNLKVRVKIVPCASADKALREDVVDVGLGSLSWTPERAQRFYYSDPYVFHDRPHGQIVRLKNRVMKLKGERPRLGVPQNTVHTYFAKSQLIDQFQICEFSTVATTIRALETFQVEYALLYPLFVANKINIEFESKPLFYPSYTAIWFHQRAENWIRPVNQLLGKMLERDLFSIFANEAGYNSY